MFIDSHCHLSFPDFEGQDHSLLDRMVAAQVSHALCVCTTLEEFGAVHQLAKKHDCLFASAGVHPDNEGVHEPSVSDLLELTQKPKVVAIGETGLDYYRLAGRNVSDMEWQRERFRTHIRAARHSDLPLIIHTRSASDDTLRILAEEGTGGGLPTARGVFHCFTETKAVASAALDLGFYISFSGIISFKSAGELREVVRQVPLDRLLIETDSPYLAPTPYRGKRNEPSFLPHVARVVASELQVDPEVVGRHTTENFFSLFSRAKGSRLKEGNVQVDY